MKKFIIGLSKFVPWLYMVVGVISVISDPPVNKYHDVNAVLAFGMIFGFILSGFLFYGLSYVIEAACLYLDKNSYKKQD